MKVWPSKNKNDKNYDNQDKKPMYKSDYNKRIEFLTIFKIEKC